MKKLIIITSLILIFTIYKYDTNNGYPLLVKLICFVVLVFSFTKLQDENTKEETFEEVEKKNDIIQNNDGIFDYKNDGFYIKQKKSLEFIKWNEIESITHFNLNMLKGVYQNGIEIVTNKKIYKIHNDKEQSMGIEKFEIEMNKNLTIDELYNSEVLSDGSSRTPLYIKPLV